MTFPTIQSITETTFGSDATSHAVAMPATVNSGDLLVCLFANDGSATVTTPSGWRAVDSATTPSSRVRGGIYAKSADGTEDGTTVDFVTSASEQAAAQVYRITGWGGDVSNDVAASTAATSDDGNPDPANLAPAWGAKDTMWLVVSFTSTNNAISTYPTNYTSGQQASSGSATTAAQSASARRSLNASSENPGTFAYAATVAYAAWTIAIEPASVAETLTCSSGSYTLTGQAMTPRLATTLPLAQGSYAYTGNAVTLTPAYRITMAQGSCALTGQAVGLTLAGSLPIAQGSYVYTGQNVELAVAARMPMDRGLYALTGQDVGVSLASALALSAGYYALTVTAPRIDYEAAPQPQLRRPRFSRLRQDAADHLMRRRRRI